MKSKGKLQENLFKGKDIDPVIAAYFEFSYLKRLYRQGWLHSGIPEARCESVAEHSFGVTILALWLADAYFPELDTCRLMRMALLHDFGEIFAGDLTPEDGVPLEDKQQLESQSVARVLGKLYNGAEYVRLWEEFVIGESPEAQFVREIDRLEMALQASVYESQGYEDLKDFFSTTSQALSTLQLVNLMEKIHDLRTERQVRD